MGAKTWQWAVTGVLRRFVHFYGGEQEGRSHDLDMFLYVSRRQMRYS